MAVTLDQIKELREATGVSMMACKAALEESNGDTTKAVEILRKKGEAKAADRSERSTSQGVIVVKAGNDEMAMVKLLCETDFVARGDDFISLAAKIAEKLLNKEINVSDRDFPEVKDAVLRMGENIQVGEMTVVSGKVLGSYVHSNKKIGVIISLSGGNEEVARDIAMHVAATNPQVISPDEVSDELVAKEKEIWAEQLAKEGKPAEILEKIMIGKEKKFREENALIKQFFVKDPEKTIEQILTSAGATLEKFVRFAI